MCKKCSVFPPQISISDYVVFDQCSLFQTLLQATQSVATVTRAPVERVVAFLSQYTQCQPSLVSANSNGVWVASGRNQLHLARGSLVGQSGVQNRSSAHRRLVHFDSFLNSYVSPGTFWQNVVPRGTVSATKWTSITSSAVPHREGDVPEHLAHPSTINLSYPILIPGVAPVQAPSCGWLRAGKISSVCGTRMDNSDLLLSPYLLT